ncbi:hypothetical protein Pan216_07190 [Planctomycetes bacterium Pan216]|uniref:Tc1-like transposase DDE domain-containing protein n=1 Tax=Kolteria novifilia TaxID=2527975 RepID=A0A518AYT5_9BACT|nr:hypothetical protein Pan216_07190 [Planctomycetes bacterium Pan216]
MARMQGERSEKTRQSSSRTRPLAYGGNLHYQAERRRHSPPTDLAIEPETRQPIEAAKDHPKRVDYEYERNGTASIFMFSEPLSGFRQATARSQRTKVDWAQEVAQLLDTRYADCQQVTLVLDNLNTHTKGAFYELFEPAVARAYVKRITFVYTPKHGSWLNVAECELSAMTRQCLTGRRVGELDELRDEIGAWSDQTNQKQRGVDWQLQIDEARTKLARLYPKIKNG